MFEITIKGTTADELKGQLEALLKSVFHIADPAPGGAKQKAAPTVKAEPKQADPPAGKAPTVVELRAAAAAKGKTEAGKTAIRELLDKYDSKSISGVPEDQRAAFLADLEAL